MKMPDTPQPTILITQRALADLDNISDYIVEQAGENRAEVVLWKIDERIRLHATMPLAGRLRDELQQGF